MSLKIELENNLKKAMLAKENVKRDVIRMALSSIKQLEKDSGKELSDQDYMAVLQKEIKTKEETIAEAKSVERDEMIPPILEEIDILRQFLPKELSDEELTTLVNEIIADTNAESMKEMGIVMKETISRVAGAATNDRISRTIREFLK
jgi:uncharacterized protein YqeY